MGYFCKNKRIQSVVIVTNKEPKIILNKSRHKSTIFPFRSRSSRQVSKEYICRVVGKFPEKLVVDEPLLTVDHARGLVQVDAKGKEAKTSFELLFYDQSSKKL